MKLSNKLTLSRALFSPVFFIIYYLPMWLQNLNVIESSVMFTARVSAFIMIPLLAIFELTDFFDGYFARKYDEVSDLGKLFDPFADVLLNMTVFLCGLKSVHTSIGGYMPVVLFALLFYREFVMIFLRMIAAKKGVAIAARKGGKVKTVCYIASGFFMLALESVLRLGFDIKSFLPAANICLKVLFSLCVILSYISFADYIKTFSKIFKEDL